MRIFFFTDASARIGAGHFSRCFNLAQVLRGRGAEISFYCRELPESFKENAIRQGMKVIFYEGEELTKPSFQPDWIILDGYDFDAAWEKKMKLWAKRFMVIDDFSNRTHECDLLLNQSLWNESPESYAERIPSSCRLLLGPRYALLDLQFAALRKLESPKKREEKTLFVNFGSSDPTNETLKVLTALEEMSSKPFKIEAVIGALNQHRGEIKKFAKQSKSVSLHVQPSNLGSLMVQSDLAVGAGGVSLWERSCVGLPSVVITTVDNQKEQVAQLAQKGKIVSLGKSQDVTAEKIRTTILDLIQSPSKLSQLREQCYELTDGKGAERVASILLGEAITVRRASRTDRANILEWRNNPLVRNSSFSADPIDAAAHEKWLSKMLASAGAALLIVELEEKPLAVLRYDLNAPEAMISIYLVPEKIGQSYGAIVIQKGSEWLKQHHPEIKTVVAEILSQNQHSERAFREAGFSKKQADQGKQRLVYAQ